MGNNLKNRKLNMTDGCFLVSLFSLIWYIWTSNSIASLIFLFSLLPLAFHPGYQFVILISLSVTEFCTGIVFGRALLDWYLLLFLVSVCLSYFSRNQNKYKASILQLEILLLIGYLIFNAFFTGTYRASSLRRFILLLLIIFFSLNREISNAEIKQALKWASCALAVLFALYFFQKIGININISRYDIELEANINSAAYSVMTIAVILIAQIIWCERSFEKILLIILLITQVILLVIISSRSALLALIFTSIVLLFLRFGNKNNRGAIFFAVGIGIAIYFVISNLNWNTIALDRLTLSSVTADKGSSRFLYWGEIVRVVLSHHWLGGIGVESNALIKQLKTNGAAISTGYTHNMILQYMVGLGIPATFLIINIEKKLFLSHKSCRKSIVFYEMVAVIVSVLLFGLGESCGFYPTLWIALLVVGISERNSVTEIAD